MAVTALPPPQHHNSVLAGSALLPRPCPTCSTRAHGGASTGPAAPAEVNQPCLTRALTGKAFPLLRDSFATTDIPLSHRANHGLQSHSLPGLCLLSLLLCWLLPPQACPFTRMDPGLWPCHLGCAVPLWLLPALHRLLPAAQQWSFLLWGLLTPHWVLSFLFSLVELQLLLTADP